MSKIKGIYVDLNVSRCKLAIHRVWSYRKESYEVHRFNHKIEVLRKVIKILADSEIDYLSKFEEFDEEEFTSTPGRKRRFISREKSGLYPRSPHLADKHSFEQNGFWIATNFGQGGIMRSLRRICKSADLRFGHVMEIDI